jgi:hypothetical protein
MMKSAENRPCAKLAQLLDRPMARRILLETSALCGVIRHSFPLIGWRDHGFLYPTTKFYAHMVGDNAYEMLKIEALLSEDAPFDDPFFKQVVDGRRDPVAPPAVTNIWGELVYRKTSDRSFAIPVDHLGGPDAMAARHRLIDNYRHVARSRIIS